MHDPLDDWPAVRFFPYDGSIVTQRTSPSYLQPYLRSVKRHGCDFPALLWASKRTQRLRFAAMVRLCDPSGLDILDLGCGRGDLMDFLLEQGQAPRRYTGLEAVPELAAAARDKRLPHGRIIRCDFVRHPGRMKVEAEVIYCSGALNTLEPETFYEVLSQAYGAARRAVVFNFLCSAELAGVKYLHWHRLQRVLDFARGLAPRVDPCRDYIDGDCTIMMSRVA